MASTVEISSTSHHDQDNPTTEPFPTSDQQLSSTSSIDSNQPPPALSRVDGDSLSSTHYIETPGSNSSLDHYQPSDFSDLDEDPFFGVDFNDTEGGTPAFLDEYIGLGQSGLMPDQDVDSQSYPLTPEQTASSYTTTPHIASNRNLGDATTVHPTSRARPGWHQPETSEAAIERFERMSRDTDFILSRPASWGTRRRSLPSLFEHDMSIDSASSGILEKFSISRRDKGNKPGGLLRDLRGLVRRPNASQLLKRNRSSGDDDESPPGSEGRGSQDSKHDSISKRESVSHPVPPARMGSWGKKPVPSINAALVSMSNSTVSIGAAHARSGSVSATPVTSPKSFFGDLSVGSIRRLRSKSDLSKSTPGMKMESHPTLVSMWEQTGGPPVAKLTNTKNTDLNGDDDDELGDDADMKTKANLIDGVTPNVEGFRQHIMVLNPDLAVTNTYLAERIAHQQVIRYKTLLRNKVQHLDQGVTCPSGALCIALGGSAVLLDQNNSLQDLDPLSSLHDGEDGILIEGAINKQTFPQDIPMPPTSRFPAEFECQICYSSKKFQKPSDWTKHVHEDVQPYTCTWDKCREPKIFKRKVDWVRHENEAHRHLQWWTCDVEACHYQCYRLDNFVQHLVREHKFPEPKVKTKAALKRAGGVDRTWQKAEQCHQETAKRPQDEPCRFCGKVFPTWKKLTVHLAKHMEQVSLPVLRLVGSKANELEADTVIIPVEDPPPQHMPPTPATMIPVMQFPVGGQVQDIPVAVAGYEALNTYKSMPNEIESYNHMKTPGLQQGHFEDTAEWSTTFPEPQHTRGRLPTPIQIGTTSKDGVTPLHSATIYPSYEAVEVLLEKGADVMAADKNGVTPLHLASQCIPIQPPLPLEHESPKVEYEMANLEYDISLTREISLAIQDSCKKAIEHIAGCRFSWWPLSEPEEELKPGYTRVYSMPFAKPSQKEQRFYDDIPTPLAETIFPKLAEARFSTPRSRWTALSREAVLLQDTTPMRLLHRWRDDVTRQQKRHQSEKPQPGGTRDAEGDDQHLRDPRDESVQEGDNQNSARSQPILFVSADVKSNESVSGTVDLGENDEVTLRNLRTAFRSLPSRGWKRATGMKFYRFRSFHFKQSLRRRYVVIDKDKERYPEEGEPEYLSYNYNPRPWEDGKPCPCLSGEAWYFFQNPDECCNSKQLNRALPVRLNDTDDSRITAWGIHIKQRQSILTIFIPTIALTLVTLAATF